MKTTLAERLKSARNSAGISQQDLGKAVGVTQAAIQKLESGKAKASTKLIDIARFLQVSPEWLLYGEGGTSSDKTKDGVPMSDIRPDAVDVWDSSSPLEDDEVFIPYFSSIELAAGCGHCNNEDYNGHKLKFSRATLRRYGADPANVVAFPVHGDSMSPVIPNGSTVTVDMGHKNIVDGGIYAIEQDELFRVKLLYRQPGKIVIRSYNADEFPEEETEMHKLKVIGRVINWSVMAW